MIPKTHLHCLTDAEHIGAIAIQGQEAAITITTAIGISFSTRQWWSLVTAFSAVASLLPET
jgi:hypothetical protein